MDKVRDDIFPKLQTIFDAREILVKIWVEEAYEALNAVFPKEEDFIKYLNSIHSHLNAELFIRSAQFYLVAKKYQKESFVKLIMMLSIMERLLSGQNEFKEFPVWVQGQDKRITELLKGIDKLDSKSYKKILAQLADDYYQVFGSRRNVLKFFENHLNKDSKIDLIQSIQPFMTDTVTHYSERFAQAHKPQKIEELNGQANHAVGKHLMPYCYDWRQCYLDYAECARDLGCLLDEDKDILAKSLKKVVDLLYQMRNDFVHDAIITPLTEEQGIVFAIVGGKEVTIELDIKEFERMFEKAFKDFFDKLP